MTYIQIISIVFIPLISIVAIKKAGWPSEMKAIFSYFFMGLILIVTSIVFKIFDTNLIDILVLKVYGRAGLVLIVLGYAFILVSIVSLFRLSFKRNV